ncbi:DUF2254 domain-containing protein [Lapillicoccus jejuensis]|uniref:Putative membrane protein n=1 Tax=Lapillicoccus jejuensis TaxID=402171 RepID=A0A542E4K7_9MICO|nr:DUF2254 domain-containing protein [Lapillicoccus jejuensis]TQJ10282.1 putative membrane protein [Lapillicoccus jejuensis]
MRQQVATTTDAVRSRLWPLPVLAVALAVLLGLLLPVLDAAVDDQFGSTAGMLAGWLFAGDADAARTVLQAVSGSLITVTSLTFSLTVVTLQLASSQFSPRLLRTFTGDVFVQGTLGLFLGTFAYALVVLRQVRSSNGTHPEFVPRLAVSLAFVLGIAGVVTLVLFLAHLAGQVRVETMMREVHADTSRLVRDWAELDRSEPARHADVDGVLGAATQVRPLLAARSGFVTAVDLPGLARCAGDHDLVCVVDRPVGSAVVAGTPVGRVGGAAAGDRQVLDQLAGHLRTGHERTAVGDLGYGLRQVTDIVAKALSPGVNDPTTAVHGLGHLSAMLGSMTRLDLRPLVERDDAGTVRAALRLPTFADLVDEALTQPRRYGVSDPMVARRLLQLLGELAWLAGDEHRQAVDDHLGRVRRSLAAAELDHDERRDLDNAVEAVDATLHRHDRMRP